MFCKNCGAQTEGDEVLCASCKAAAEVPVAEEVTSAALCDEKGEEYTGKYGLKPALLATIFGVVGVTLAVISLTMLSGASAALPNLQGAGPEALVPQIISTIVGMIFGFAVIPFAIIAIVNGAKSIKAFIAAKKNANAKPIATLILGIAGVVYGANGVICAMMLFVLSIVNFVAIGALML